MLASNQMIIYIQYCTTDEGLRIWSSEEASGWCPSTFRDRRPLVQYRHTWLQQYNPGRSKYRCVEFIVIRSVVCMSLESIPAARYDEFMVI